MVFCRLKEVHSHRSGARWKCPAYSGGDVAKQALSLVGSFQDRCYDQESGEQREDGRVRSPFGQKELPVLECPPERQAYPSKMHERIRVTKAGYRLQGTGDREPFGN